MSTAVNGSRTKGILLLAVVFVLGLIIGGALFVLGMKATRWHGIPGPLHGERDHTEQFIRTLDLDKVQQKEIQQILTNSRDRMMEHFIETREEIRKVLRDDQLEQFDRMHPPHLSLHGMPAHPPHEPPHPGGTDHRENGAPPH